MNRKNYTQKSSFYYAVNLTNYKIEQENVLTFHFETNISNVQILAKEVEVQKESDLPSNMPSSLSDSTIEISKSDVPNYYHLFFSNIIIGDDLIFLIVNITTNNSKGSEEKFSVVASKKSDFRILLLQIKQKVKYYPR